MLTIIRKLQGKKGQFALDIALGMAIVLVISAFVIMPGLKGFSNTFISSMNSWWTNTISTRVFSTSGN